MDEKQREHGWYCPKCNLYFFHPDDDEQHAEWHESVDIVWASKKWKPIMPK